MEIRSRISLKYAIRSVHAQWITAMKDWKEAKRRHKMHREQNSTDLPSPPPTEHVKGKPEGVYEKDMDAMRCILYLHGGMIVCFCGVVLLNPIDFRRVLLRKC